MHSFALALTVLGAASLAVSLMRFFAWLEK